MVLGCPIYTRQDARGKLKMNLQKLDWDSTFFGLPVFRGIPGDECTVHEIVEAATKTDCRLLYVPSPLILKEDTVASLGAVLVDIKTTFVKRLRAEHLSVGSVVESYTMDDHISSVLGIAVQSGEFSRFNVDRKLPHGAFKKLYETWMHRSILREIAKEVFVVRENGIPVGLITLGEKNGRADIGILAVDTVARGKGYGVDLVNAAENWFIDSGYTHGQVVTQGANMPACALYRKCGYEIDGTEFFYHVWL
jgi:dTDP-4-amino-4,6-dideoxy-D-galactose acyltransferase